jgi:hypothetical protein
VESYWVNSALRPPMAYCVSLGWLWWWRNWWNNWQGNRSTRRKPAPVPLCPPQTPHAARTRTRAAAVASQRLTAWATARPCLICLKKIMGIRLLMTCVNTFFFFNWNVCQACSAFVCYSQVYESGTVRFCTKDSTFTLKCTGSRLWLTVLTIFIDRCLIICLQRKVNNWRNKNTMCCDRYIRIISARADTCVCHFGIFVFFILYHCTLSFSFCITVHKSLTPTF